MVARLFWLLAFLFSFWLMWHTFSYDPTHNDLLISAKVWSDFGQSIPLIRSFSRGFNLPVQHPLFPGEPIRYHFLFYAIVGLLEMCGLRIDFALNIPSAIGFFLLFVMVWRLSYKLFSSKLTSALSVLFLVLNGSFSWLDFLSRHPLVDLPNLSQFPSFGPWNGSLISAFWNLNIYTNQRHLGLSFAVGVGIILLLLGQNKKHATLLGLLAGSLLMINQAVFPVIALFMVWFFICYPSSRRQLLISSLWVLPWLILYLLTIQSPASISYHPGFLMTSRLTPDSVLYYWFLNIGFHCLLIPLGFILAPPKAKLLIIPIVCIFVISNLFQFSPDIINNHKLINFFLILAQCYSAYALSALLRKNILTKLITIFIFPIFILGGLVDFFPVVNDRFLRVSDLISNPDAKFFLTNTKPSDVILNSTWFYHPASLAGRKIFSGYTYFTWSFGYNQAAREKIVLDIYENSDKNGVCELLLKNHISFVELNDHPEPFIKPNLSLWKEFTPAYRNNNSGVTIYSVSDNCRSL